MYGGGGCEDRHCHQHYPSKLDMIEDQDIPGDNIQAWLYLKMSESCWPTPQDSILRPAKSGKGRTVPPWLLYHFSF